MPMRCQSAAIAAALEDILPLLNGGGLGVFRGEVRQVIDKVLMHLNGAAKRVAAHGGAMTCRYNGKVMVVLPAERLEFGEKHKQRLPRLLFSSLRRPLARQLEPIYWLTGKGRIPVWRVGRHIVFVAPAMLPASCLREERELEAAKAEARQLLAKAIDLPPPQH